MLSVGVVLGFFLGGLAPRRELSARDEEIARLRRELANAGSGRTAWRSPVPGLDRVLREPENGGGPSRPLPSAGAASAREDAPGDEPAQEPTGELERVLDAGTSGDGRPEREREDERLSAFQHAVSIQRVRRMQSRAALAEQAELSDEEMRAVDATLTAMNEELRGYGEELLLLAMSDEPPAARDLLGITHDVTGILHRAQLRLEEIVGPERMANVHASALEIWNFIDLAELEPAARATFGR